MRYLLFALVEQYITMDTSCNEITKHYVNDFHYFNFQKQTSCLIETDSFPIKQVESVIIHLH